ncbi:hypothetical protein MBLNU230_g7925t1 [Neophaeotheca triangularis]
MAPASPFAKQLDPGPRSLPTRDHADPDADTSPARKKMRLSEEADDNTASDNTAQINDMSNVATSVSPSPFFALGLPEPFLTATSLYDPWQCLKSSNPLSNYELANSGSSPESAITIAMDNPYSGSFRESALLPPLDEYRQVFLARDPLHPQIFDLFLEWLETHLSESSSDNSVQRLARYSADVPFFNTLGDTLKALLNRNTLFDLRPDQQRSVRLRMFEIYEHVAKLCLQLLPLLPGSLEGALSRRDSAQPSPKAPQDVPLFGYIDLLANLFRPSLRTTKCLLRDYDLNFDVLESKMRKEMVHNQDLFQTLTKIVAIISAKPSIIKGAWTALTSGLTILFRYPSWLATDGNNEIATDEVEELIQLSLSQVLPAVCREKPSSFSNELLLLCADGLSVFFADHCDGVDLDTALALYSCYARASGDHVLLGEKAGEGTENALRELCGDDAQVVLHMLRVAWTMQACKSYLQSDFMVTRTFGMKRMSEELVAVFHECAGKPAGTGLHPVLHYLVQFLRCNDLIGYIFSAKSHANLVSLSVDTVGFLAATSHYSNQDTDAIWQACTTSVEAEFVQASIKVLMATSRYLDVEQALHLAAKYIGIPLHSLDKTLVALLPNLYQSIWNGSERSGGAIAERSVLVPTEIARAVGARNTFEESSSANVILDSSLQYLSRYTASRYTQDDRKVIYERCAADIIGKTREASNSVRIVAKLFAQCQDPVVLDLLPPRSVVEEFCHFVDGFRSHESVVVQNACLHRLRLILYLINTGPKDEGKEESWSLLWDYAIGPQALNGACRDAAWIILLEASANDDLLRACLTTYVPTLSSQYVTPRLLDLLENSLKKQIVSECTNDFGNTLRLPQWSQLSRIVTEAPMQNISARAARIMNNAMYEFPLTLDNFEAIKGSVMECQVAAVRTEVDKLTGLKSFPEFFRHMTALKGMLSLSMSTRNMYDEQSATPHSIILNDYDKDSEDAFEVQLGMQGRRENMVVLAGSSSRLCDLHEVLRARFGIECKVFVGEQNVDLTSESPLADAGLRMSDALTIQPVLALDDDPDGLFASKTPVERELSDQYDRLQTHLDSSDEEIARETLDFLGRLRPSPSPRHQILATDKSPESMVPRDRTYRTAHTFVLMGRHLELLGQSGASDMCFKAKALQLILLFLSEPAGYSETLIVRAILALQGCLDAESNELAILSHVEQSTSFVRCLISTLQTALDRPASKARGKLLFEAYHTLLLACELHVEVWNAFIQRTDGGLVQTRLLLDLDKKAAELAGLRLNAFYTNQESDPSNHRSAAVWQMLIHHLPKALRCSDTAEDYYKILGDLASKQEFLTSNEDEVRDLIDSLRSKLFGMTHSETPEAPFPDSRIRGLMNILLQAVAILETFGTPIALQELSQELFVHLLWPKIDDQANRPLMAPESRQMALELVKKTCHGHEAHLNLVEVFQSAIDEISSSEQRRWLGRQEWIRSPSSNCGLSNLGQTCYMNSLLQQLFGNVGLRELILNTQVDDNPQHAVLRATQELFAEMQDSIVPWSNTEPLARLLSIQWDTQEDVHTFHSLFMTQLEDSMPDADTKSKFRGFFNGKALSQIRGACGHVSETAEAFGDLSVVVKNKANLHDSVDEFMQGEPMAGDNQYKCYTCDEANGTFVDAMKRNCLAEIPDNLAVCLKRFQFDDYGNNTKLNDRFEFPEDIDMSIYKKSHLMSPGQPHPTDLFRLVGVIVHLGSLDYGHYWSYVRLRGTPSHLADRWVRLEDRLASHSSFQEVQAQCFGDGTGTDSAYVLFYQRISSIEDDRELTVEPSTGGLAPPRVRVLPDIAERIASHNRWRQRIAQFHEPATVEFLHFLLQSLDSEPVSSEENSALQSQIARITTTYIMHVQFGNCLYADAKPIFEAITARATLNPLFAHHIIQSVKQGDIDMSRILNFDNYAVRELVYSLLLTCLDAVRQHSPNLYGFDNVSGVSRLLGDGDFGSIVKAHISSFHVLKRMPFWKYYFGFAGRLAKLGVNETAVLLDHDLLRQCFDLLYTPYSSSLKAEYSELHSYIQDKRDNLEAVYDFLALILGSHVNLTNVSTGEVTPDDELHIVGPDGCLLRLAELNPLIEIHSFSKPFRQEIILISRGLTACREKMYWQDYSPGKLIGVLTQLHVDHAIRTLMMQGIVERYKNWTNNLAPLLQYTLHYCKANGDDQSTQMLLVELSKEIVAWPSYEPEMLTFAEKAVVLAPCSTLSAFQILLLDLLNPAKSRIPLRRRAENWYKQHVFDPPTINLPPTAATGPRADDDSVASAPPVVGTPFDVSRIRITRYLVDKCATLLTSAHRQRYASRDKWDQMINAMQEAKSYLDRLSADRKTKLVSGVQPCMGLVAESNEASGTLVNLNRLLASLRNWQPNDDDETLAYGLPVDAVLETVESDDDSLASDETEYTDEPL